MNLENLSIVIGPNLFELTSDEMVNLNITVISSEIYKNLLRMRKTERDNAEVKIYNILFIIIFFNNIKINKELLMTIH